MKKRFAIVLFLNMICLSAALAEIDAMQMALLKPYQNKATLRWDNVVDHPYWRGGIAPVYFPQWKIQGIHLKPGQHSSFFLPAHESLRLYHPDRQLKMQDFNVSISNGTGLLVNTELRYSKGHHSLLVMPQSPKPLLIRIKPVSDAVEFAVFVSRKVLPGDIAPYRNFKWLSANWVGISDKPLQIPEIYNQMQAHKLREIEVEGPTRLLLKSRLRYEREAAELFQDYHIRFQLGDDAAKWLNFSTGAESSRLIFVNAQLETLGREQRAYLEIPSGRHQVQFMSDRNVYLQLLEQSEQDYLFPALNQPSLTVQAVREAKKLSEQFLVEISDVSENAVRENSVHESAMVGQQLLQQAALKYPEHTAGLKKSSKLLAQRTFYRNLLPTVKNSRIAQFKAYFINRALRSLNANESDAILAPQHLGDGLQRLASAYFIPLETHQKAEQYLLSKRYAPGLIRLIVDKRHCQQQQFKLQMDDQSPLSFGLSCREETDNVQSFVHSLPEAALKKLKEQGDNDTSGIQFAAFKEPGKLISVAVLEVKLPQQIKKFTLWREDQNKVPLNVAVQIRASKPYQFSEQSYLARLHGLSKDQLFQLFVDDLKGESNLHTELEQSLMNQWIPLKRLLKGQFNLYKSAVAKKIPQLRQADPDQLQRWRKKALYYQQHQQWLEALEKWSRVVEYSQGLTRDRAQSAQADILWQLSENYFAKRLWSYLTLHADESVAELAEKSLTSIYRDQHDDKAIQMLSVAMFMRSPDKKHLDCLMESLLANKHYRFVLILGLLTSEQAVDTMLKAAYRLNWWQTYEQLLASLPEQKRHFWRGLKAQKQGDYQAALLVWQKMNKDSWYHHLKQGMKLRKQHSNDRDISQIYYDWSVWQSNHPGGRVWEDAAKWVTDAAGGDQIYVVERDLHSQVFRAEANRPAKTKILGPAKLNFQVRPLHRQGDSASSIEGWLRITDNNEKPLYPIVNNRPSQGLQLIGTTEFVPGSLIDLEYQVGLGIHEISIYSDDAPITVSINGQRPELPVTVMAPLQIGTLEPYAKLRTGNST